MHAMYAYHCVEMHAGIHIPMFTIAPQPSRALDYIMMAMGKLKNASCTFPYYFISVNIVMPCNSTNKA